MQRKVNLSPSRVQKNKWTFQKGTQTLSAEEIPLRAPYAFLAGLRPLEYPQLEGHKHIIHAWGPPNGDLSLKVQLSGKIKTNTSWLNEVIRKGQQFRLPHQPTLFSIALLLPLR